MCNHAGGAAGGQLWLPSVMLLRRAHSGAGREELLLEGAGGLLGGSAESTSCKRPGEAELDS